MTRIVVDQTTGTAVAFTPYEALAALKAAIPSSARRWDSTRKCWHLDGEWCVPLLRTALQNVGYRVACTYQDGTPWPKPTAAATPAAEPFAWLAAAFRDAGHGQAREDLRKALLRVWHPDRGHPAIVAQQINTEANRKDPR